MKSADLALVSSIRRRHRDGIGCAILAWEYHLSMEVITAVLRCRTREGAVRVLENCKGITADDVKNKQH